jgi:hypothetical protein
MINNPVSSFMNDDIDEKLDKTLKNMNIEKL